MKVETWLRMAGIPYEHRPLQAPARSSTGKVPYIERPDGTLLSDSSRIVRVLGAERGVDLDDGLSPAERSALLFARRAIEEHYYFLAAHDRRIEPEGWARSGRDYFAPTPMPLRLLLPPMIRRQVRRDLWGQGLSRLDREERARRVDEDLDAIAALLGDGDHFFGRATTLDATAFAFLSNVIHAPIDGPAHRAARARPRLVAYERRMWQLVFPDFPRPGGA
ncbi:MAG: glutathione S-transferase family protein [Deltaproteobacteria bacterium]|nr:glutathione S-transferase family protein [Deltaproteobacteria bacterium]